MGETDQGTAPPRGEQGELFPEAPVELTLTLKPAEGAVDFVWMRSREARALSALRLRPVGLAEFLRFSAFVGEFDPVGIEGAEHCGATPQSIQAMLRRIRARTPAAVVLRVGVLSSVDLGPAAAGKRHAVETFPAEDGWKWLGRVLAQWARVLERNLKPAQAAADAAAGASESLHVIAAAMLGVQPATPGLDRPGLRGQSRPGPARLLELRVAFDLIENRATFEWRNPDREATVAVGVVSPAEFGRLKWEMDVDGQRERAEKSAAEPKGVQERLGGWLQRFATDQARVSIRCRKPQRGTDEARWEDEPPFGAGESPMPFVQSTILDLAEAHFLKNSALGRMAGSLEQVQSLEFTSHLKRLERKEQKRVEEETRRQATIARLADERRQREAERAERRAAGGPKDDEAAKAGAANSAPRVRAPLPPVPVAVRLPPLAFQETAFPLADFSGQMLRERAALWWVSNQSDDLLCLPQCRIQRLEYQVRTALRVLGPLRGRALLSDEVGLGKTIEAGLITKELFTRGMVKRFLVLTLPSLVDQWAEELAEKFGLATVTTNQTGAREDPARFWSENPGIVASLHTLKQPAQLAVAREVHWDMLIVDEAHYLRNRSSQAWQAVNALPRQFLLLLTATPVQNSLEELYNLVTLLQPGQLPTPKEFRARFLDPERPRQPREPEELRRLLGQVMIRNTRANAGIDLPPRRAETAVFAPDAAEAEFWRSWEAELRARLATLGASQASLWGRLLLQAAGSSPAAWRAALEKFPDAAAARAWRGRAPLETSWRRKCELLLPLTRGENGAVIFTQFLDTQAALADFLRGAGVATWVINGSTPAADRQPITEDFRRQGGALLLTHSGTEGRNLQFCHTLANFDLPWNPMEIEQRIGRLHRLGQRQPVRIYNFVQEGTLQDHLLQVLQEKLNLFELVVGETGLVLGERFSGDEFEEEIFRRWEASAGRVGEALAGFGEELAGARGRYEEVKQLDGTLFARDFESS